MIPRNLLKFILFSLLFVALPVSAEENSSNIDTIALMLGVDREHIRQGPVAGLYELQSGAKIYYLSRDGKYLITGSIIDLANHENLTENRLKEIRKEILSGVNKSEMIVFKADKPEHVITVFTDVDCGYCRKLHSQIKEYNALGITVQYLFYPRTGIGTPSYQKAVSVWCSKDRRDALTRAKLGEELPEKDCDNPVDKQFTLGTELGIHGTPAILTEAGDLLPGYMPPQYLKKELDTLADEALATTMSSGDTKTP